MLIENVRKKFIKLFKEEPLLVRSPGRVNLIGEHTDYNLGFVLPAAIDNAIYYAISPRNDNNCKLYSVDLDEDFNFEVDDLKYSEKRWPNYLMGVVDQLNKTGIRISGFNCVFGGDIPLGAGLSSSAAIGAGLAFSLNHIFNLGIDKLSLVKLAQKSENEFAGVNCGIMDQFVNIFGAEGRVLKIDCRSFEYEYHPLANDELRIVLCNTMVTHSLADSEYNRRRAQCESGVQTLQQYNPEIKSLRDVPLEHLFSHKSNLDETIFRRCKYVIEENERVTNACSDLEKKDFDSFGQRMYESHRGLRDEYEVSCPELDFMAEEALYSDEVIGARMMGGGFGGCTINLVYESNVKKFKSFIEKAYKKKYNKKPPVYICRIEGGTQIIS
ncbi:MAG: galactokinase [Ignavibacteriae bacterium HGW-Ignavibacteriae-3]|nr:MAG: galactokinase [Ignavibacteriae bacterium HGW-Ignavibacteriae-3]